MKGRNASHAMYHENPCGFSVPHCGLQRVRRCLSRLIPLRQEGEESPSCTYPRKVLP